MSLRSYKPVINTILFVKFNDDDDFFVVIILVVDCCEYEIVLWRLNELTPIHAASGIDNLVDSLNIFVIFFFFLKYCTVRVRTFVQIIGRITYGEQIFPQKPTAQFQCPI